MNKDATGSYKTLQADTTGQSPPMLARGKPEPLGVELRTISPAQAKEWLKLIVPNRNISDNLVRDYAKAMEEGRWRINAETIKFDPFGKLLDGRHRLTACVMANKPFKAFVARGVATDSFDTIDVGRRRTAGDMLHIDGVKNANAVAGMVKLLGGYAAGKTMGAMSSYRIMPDEILQRIHEDPTIADSCNKAISTVHGMIPPAIAGFLFHVFRQKNQAQTELFFRDLQVGTGLKGDDPVWKLRERLMRNARSNPSKRLTRDDIILMVVKTWNARRTGQPVGLLKGVVRGESGSVKLPTIR